jgi:octaprenyl-diphosphate synthase
VAASGLKTRVEEIVGTSLAAAERIFAEELASSNAYIRDVNAHVGRFRGKRLRPTLVLLSASACGSLRPEHELLAAVVEMIHVATLVHDDVLDEASVRRHVATVNGRWNNETSVLFGDYLFTHAFHLCSRLETTLACRWIGRATNVVCEGELTQIRERGNLDLDEATYLRIVDGKTAELCAVSCRLGAHFAGSDPARVDALEQYGRDLGIAFQIADDLLDVLGTEAETGKSLGSDLQKQKLTLPLIRLLAQSAPDEAARLRELLSQPDAQTASRLQPFFEQSDAIPYARHRAAEFAGRARQALHGLPDTPARRALAELADFAAERST